MRMGGHELCFHLVKMGMIGFDLNFVCPPWAKGAG